MKKAFFLILLLLGCVETNASNLKILGNAPDSQVQKMPQEQRIVVDMENCHLLNSPKDPFILVLTRGEPLLESIRICMKRANIECASISGIGVLLNPTLSEFDSTKNRYKNRKFRGLLEVASINGTTTLAENGKVLSTICVIFTDANFRALGGLLVEGKVGVLIELTIVPL